MTLEKPRERKDRPRSIYVTIRDKSEPSLRTRNFSVYGATLEQVEKRIKRAISAQRREPAAVSA